MKLTSLENKIGSALLKKAEEVAKSAAKDQYDALDDVDRQILALCATPATDSRIKQFFTARDADNKTHNIDHKIQLLMRQGFLGRGANKYVLNPEYREFITVMPMSASVAKVAEGLAEDVMLTPDIDPEVIDEIRNLVIANEATLEVIAEEIAAKYDLDEAAVYDVAQMVERTGGKKEAAGDDFAELTKDVLFDEGLSRDVIDEIRELVTAQELTLEVIAEEIADKYNLDEEDVYAAAQKIERTGSVKKSFSLKKKPKVAELDFSFNELVELPVLREGHSSDLKIDDGKMRVWLLRTGEGIDGYSGSQSGYIVEKLEDGRWEEVAVERNIDPSAHIGAKIDEITVGNVKLKTVKDSETGEWIVKYYENGKFQEGPTYYTDDKQDALDTMADMANRLEKQATDIGLGMGIVDRTEREEMRESLIGAEGGYDEKAANDLSLFMENDHHFYQTHYMPAVTSIVNFIHSGEATDELLFDITKDMVMEGVKEYNRSDIWDNYDFDEATIAKVAQDNLDFILQENELGNYDELLDNPISDKEKTSIKKRLAHRKAAAFLGGSTSYTFNKHTLPNQAIRFARKFLSNYRFPIAPDITYTAVKNASTDDNNCTVDGDVLITVNFRTLSGVRKAADLIIPVRSGELLEPSTFQIDGTSYIVSQSAIDNIIKSATFYNKPAIGDVFSNPLDRETVKKLEKSKLPTFNRGMFSI